jgi:hypothetical protein
VAHRRAVKRGLCRGVVGAVVGDSRAGGA